MATNRNDADFEEDIDEAEEEALLRSDDENDAIMTSQGNVGEDSSPLDDDDDDEEEDDDDEQAKKQFDDLLKEIEQNPFVYDNYVRLCKISHVTTEFHLIRKAYALFAHAYPLTSEYWLKYLDVEKSMAQSPEEIQRTENLFRTSLKDYYSVEIAMEFIKFAEFCQDADAIWQEMLSTYGLHTMRGQTLFKNYRQYVAKNAKLTAEQKQNKYIESCLQELKFPLLGMEDLYIEFKVFYERNKEQLAEVIDWANVDRLYFKAKEHLQIVLPFEVELQALAANCYRERAEVYFRYIKKTDKFLDENVLQTIYERMVADCCLNVNCWLTYVNFLDYRDEFGRPKELQAWPVFQQDAVDVSKRGIRNCPWSSELYINQMWLLEKRKCSREAVQEVLESSCTAGFHTAQPAVAVWIEYLTYLARITDYDKEDECEILRKNFNLCWTILGQQWGVLADCNCEILLYWGRLEYGPLKNPKRGKELWTTAMESSDNATKSGLWIEFALLEKDRDIHSARKLYRTALNSPGLDNVAVICSAWERFERCKGTSKTISECKRECKKILDQCLEKANQQSPVQSRKPLKRKAGDNEYRNKETTEKRGKFPASREEGSSKTHSDMATEEHAQQEIDTAKDHLRIFLSNLDYNLTEDELREALQELNISKVDFIRNASGRSRGFGYLELQSEKDVQKALEMDRRNINGRPLFVSSVLRDKEKRQKFKYSDDIEPTKLFVKSLPHDATQSEVEDIFKPFGKLKDVRLVYHKSGKFKNIAYIEYENEAAARKALMATNLMDLRGHTISVAISAPPPKIHAPATPNLPKMLGIGGGGGKRNISSMELKPRMSFIPTAVRNKISADNKAMPPPAAPTSAMGSSSSNGTPTTAAKSNADFRQMLLK